MNTPITIPILLKDFFHFLLNTKEKYIVKKTIKTISTKKIVAITQEEEKRRLEIKNRNNFFKFGFLKYEYIEKRSRGRKPN